MNDYLESAVVLIVALIFAGFLLLRVNVTWSAVAAPAGQVTVRDTIFLKDGKPWRAKGVNVGAFTQPKRTRVPGQHAAIFREEWGAEELVRARSVFGIDTIRLVVSQAGLDPQSPIYDPSYIGEISDGVALARGLALNVILCVGAQGSGGLAGLPNMPTKSTVRAWESLAPRFGSDRGVLFELFNEPDENGHRGAEAWKVWQAAFQPVLTKVRQLGSRNLVLLDGLWFGRVISDAPKLNDPLNQLAYAVHPYLLKDFDSPTEWNKYFGRKAATAPVIVTEWNGTPKNTPCVPDMPAKETLLLDYLHKVGKSGIGLNAYSLNYPETLLEDMKSWKLTNYDHFVSCGDSSGSGGGELFSKWRP